VAALRVGGDADATVLLPELKASLLRLGADAVFGADVFRHYKPDPETYLGAAALLGCEPSEVMLVASHPSDLAAAAACGVRTCYVSRPLEYGPDVAERCVRLQSLGVVVEESPAKGRVDLMVEDLLELSRCAGC
jgi:FMN phosphatase YigB (HAD superfamily)